MSQNENVLPATIVRAIGDKLYDRRKTAALEVEGLVKNLAAQVTESAHLLHMLTFCFCLSHVLSG